MTSYGDGAITHPFVAFTIAKKEPYLVNTTLATFVLCFKIVVLVSIFELFTCTLHQVLLTLLTFL